MYRELSKALKSIDVDQTYLATLLGLSQSAISRRFTGQTPWDIGEMYKILEILHEPTEKLHVFFPEKEERERAKCVKTHSHSTKRIRTVEINGEAWIALKDTREALGLGASLEILDSNVNEGQYQIPVIWTEIKVEENL